MIKKLHNPLDKCELKIDSEAKGTFSGYASVFDEIDNVGDTITPGAYKSTLKNSRSPSMFVNHNSYEVPIGDWKELKEDEKGLFGKGIIDMNHKDGPTVFSALKRGAMDGLSIGFMIPKGGAEINDEGIRVIKHIDLKEISIVNFPADTHARIEQVKAEIETIQTLREAEYILRESGYTKSAATALVSRIKTLARRDADLKLQDEITELKKAINEKSLTDQLVEAIKQL